MMMDYDRARNRMRDLAEKIEDWEQRARAAEEDARDFRGRAASAQRELDRLESHYCPILPPKTAADVVPDEQLLRQWLASAGRR